jgi:aminobenzoyl-glutamate utilization protein B
MTQTKTTHTILAATWELLPNKVLARVGDANVTAIGAPRFTPQDQKFGRAILESLGIHAKGSAFDGTIESPDLTRTFPDVEVFPASSDLGNVSWLIPTLSFSAACKARGTPQHSWQMVSQACSSPAWKAGITVAKWMAAGALDCLRRPEIIAEAWKEHRGYLADTTFYHPIPDEIAVPRSEHLYGVNPSRL